MAMTKNIHLIIMDVMMPKLNGLSALMKLRERKNIPVIMLSAKSESTDKVLGLSMGADDYMTKPFESDELIARVKAQLRRYVKLGGADSAPTGDELVCGDLCFNCEAHTLTVRGEYVKLTATETKIMELLMSNPGRIFPAWEIYERVWGEDSFACENTVMVHVRQTTRKIEINPKETRIFKGGMGHWIQNRKALTVRAPATPCSPRSASLSL